MTYERMNIYAAYSQLQSINENASVNPAYLRMFINKKFVYLRSMVHLAVFTYDYTIEQQTTIQAKIHGYNNNCLFSNVYTVVTYPLFENI